MVGLLEIAIFLFCHISSQWPNLGSLSERHRKSQSPANWIFRLDWFHMANTSNHWQVAIFTCFLSLLLCVAVIYIKNRYASLSHAHIYNCSLLSPINLCKRIWNISPEQTLGKPNVSFLWSWQYVSGPLLPFHWPGSAIFDLARPRHI